MRYEFTLAGSTVIEADTLDEAKDLFADSQIDEIVMIDDIKNLDNPDEDCMELV